MVASSSNKTKSGLVHLNGAATELWELRIVTQPAPLAVGGQLLRALNNDDASTTTELPFTLAGVRLLTQAGVTEVVAKSDVREVEERIQVIRDAPKEEAVEDAEAEAPKEGAASKEGDVSKESDDKDASSEDKVYTTPPPNDGSIEALPTVKSRHRTSVSAPEKWSP